MSEKYLNRLRISAYDLVDSNRYLQELEIPGIESTQKEALLISAVICHARPFTGNEKNEVAASSRIKIDDFQEITSKQLELHKRIMEVRDPAAPAAPWGTSVKYQIFGQSEAAE